VVSSGLISVSGRRMGCGFSLKYDKTTARKLFA
jgi:hypothetical protein